MSFRGGRGGNFGGSSRGGSRGGFGGSAGGSRGGRGGFNRYDSVVPDEVVQLGTFCHAAEGEMVCKSTNEKIPYFNAPIFTENKTQIGKIDEILGPVNEVYFTVKCQDGVVASSFKANEKVFVGGDKLLPLDRFLPKPKVKAARVKKTRGGADSGRGGSRGGARGASRGSFGAPRGGARGGFGGSSRGAPRGGSRGGFGAAPSRGGFGGSSRGGSFRGGRGGY